jgi:hypothetical protein
VAVDYRNPSVMYLTTSAGIFRRVGDSPWTFVHPLKAWTLAVDFGNADILWAGAVWTTEYNSILLKSTDAGRTWGKADFGMQCGMYCWVSAIAIDPVDPNVMYANVRYSGRFGWPSGWVFRGGPDGHWERLEVGAASQTTFEFPGQEGACMANGLALDPNLRRLYVGCDAYYYNKNQFLMLKSDNAHEPDSSQVRWEQAASLGESDPYFGIGSFAPLAVNAREPKSLYAALMGRQPGTNQPYRLLVSHDDGKTWENLAVPDAQN